MSEASLLETLRASAPGEALPPLPDWQPRLAVLRRAFGLSGFEADLLQVAALPEIHEAWGDAMARLGASWRRPTLGVALRLLVPDAAQRAEVGLGITRLPVLRSGLVRLGLPELPEPDRPLRPSIAALSVLQGFPPLALESQSPVRVVDPTDGALLLRVRPSLRDRVAALGDARVVEIGRAGEGGALELALALAASRGCPLLRVLHAPCTAELLQDANVLAAMGQVVLVHAAPGGSAWALDAAPPAGALVLDPAGATVHAEPAAAVRVVDVPPSTPLEIADLWRALVPDLPGDEVGWDALANQTRLDLRAMRRAVADARAEGELSVRGLQVAVSQGRSDPPSDLARVSRPFIRWDALVVPEDVHGQLSELRARVDHRVTVQYRWGLSHETGRGDGVVALLHGDSGVGKTYACEVLASALGLPLVKVDLSRVVSKYIGETEKNLERVFSMAEGFGYLLLFDEADAVFGKRTGVRDAHDRYANIETNYLLQRLETFEGIAVLSTNLLKNIDEAFLRRLQLVIHLPRPTVLLRRELWDRVLPAGVRGADVDLDELARSFDLVGGEIRNAAVRGAYAAARSGGLLTRAVLHDAIRIEFAKKGRPFPARL